MKDGIKIYLIDAKNVRKKIDIDYSVSGNEFVFIKINNKINKIKLCELYEIFKNEKNITVLSLNKDKLKYSWEKLINVIKHETVEPLLKITTRCNRSVTVTQSHSCLTVNDDGKIVEIKPSDMKIGGTLVPILGKLNGNITKWDISSYKGKTRKNSIIFDSIILTKELGFLLGIYLAEGDISYGRTINISNIDVNIRQKVKESVNLLKLNCNENNPTKIVFSSKQLSNAIKTEFGLGSLNKKIPTWVLDSPIEFRESLIDGYWSGDGSVLIQNNWSVTASANTDSKELSEGLQLILSSLGIQVNVTLYNYTHKGFKNPHTIHYRLSVASSCIGMLPQLTHLNKENNRLQWKTPEQDTLAVAPVPLNLTKGYLRQKGKKGYCGLSYVRRNCSDLIVDKLSNGNIIWDVVSKIEEVDFEDYSYDLEINENRTFVLSGGITVHNTMGGHAYVYPKYVPEDEVWADIKMEQVDQFATIVHELVERNLMKNKHITYSKAHEEASRQEKKIRKILI